MPPALLASQIDALEPLCADEPGTVVPADATGRNRGRDHGVARGGRRAAD
jgi:gluconate kinase